MGFLVVYNIKVTAELKNQLTRNNSKYIAWIGIMYKKVPNLKLTSLELASFSGHVGGNQPGIDRLPM